MKTTTPEKSELSHSETEKLLTISDNNLKQLRSIFQNAPAAIAIFNGPQHRFIMANLKYQKQNNRTEKDLLGKTYQEVYPELEGTGSFEIIDNVYKTGKTFTASEYEAKIDLNNNGVPTQYYFNFSLEALKNESDEIYGLMVMSYDVTEQILARKKIEETEQRFRLATEASGIGIWEWNVITNQIKWDAKMFEIYGVKPTNDGFVLYNTWKDAVVPEDFEEQEKILQDTLKNSSHSKRSFKIVRADDGILRHIEAVETVRTNDAGQAEWIIGTNVDFTEQVNARKKIEETEHKYENLIFTSPYMIAIFKGKNLIIEIANDAILETWGKGKNVIGKSFYDVLPEAVEQGFHKLILNVFETGEPYHAYETPITLWRNEKWELMYYNFIYQAQRNMKGEIEGVAIVANEVTPQVQDKMKIIESEERFRLLADNLPLSVFVANPTIEASINYVNKYWLEYTKQTFEEAIGKGWNDIVHPDDVHLIMDVYLDAYAKQIPYSTPNIRIKRHDGVYRWFTFHGNPRFLNNGEFVGMIGAGFDITEQKLFELELIEEKIKAENAVQAKQQFLSNMSHEIRTPMNAIVGFTNVILKTELKDSQKQYLDAIKVSGDALVVLINDILDLAKVDSGKMTFDKTAFDLADCINKIVLLFELKLKENKIQFNLNLDDAIPNQIIGDPMRLRQIIINLLSNAVKFTDKGSISLDVKVVSNIKNKINIDFKITDTGIGIPKEKLEAIFNNFEQAHAETSANYGGTGLGLAIVKKMVENQGGTIATNSEVGKGTTFLFNLEFETNISQHSLLKKTTKKGSNNQSDTHLKNIKILVAEDVMLNQLLIKIILGNFNFEVDIAENGKIAIEKIKTNTYNLVLMDLHMSEMNGIEATKYIREEMKSQIPIIALTADVTQTDINKCMAVGMQDHISKPIDEALLYEKIVKVLNENKK